MMRSITKLPTGLGLTIAILAVAITGCGKAKQTDPRDVARARIAAKRQQAACASQTAYDRVKGFVFDQAIGQRDGDRTNLDVLADYSTARMEAPVVDGWDPTLDITRCKGRFVLDIPAGAERGLGGERRLQVPIEYTAQAAADGSGLVYRVTGADPMIDQLAAFNLNGLTYRPPPAIDNPQAALPPPVEVVRADVAEAMPSASPPPPPRTLENRRVERPAPPPPPPREAFAPRREREDSAAREPYDNREQDNRGQDNGGPNDDGESVVRAFYGALGDGDGASASARIIPEKRNGRAFSPEAIERFYGGLAEPLRLTGIAPVGNNAYRVSYRYSAGRSRCDGSAIVTVTGRGDLIRSIRALNGC